MDKNLLLAVTLSIAVYAAWFGFVEKRVAPKQAAPVVAQSQAGAPELKSGSAAAASAAPAARPASAEQDVIQPATIDDADVEIRSKGAGIVSWKFHGPRGTVQLVSSKDPGLLSTFPELAFKPAAAGAWEARSGDVRVLKEFVPAADKQLPKLRITMQNLSAKPAASGEWTISIGPGLGTIETEKKENESVTRTLGLLKGANGLNGKIEKFETGVKGVDYRWVGVSNRYFLAALLPSPEEFSKTEAFAGHRLTVTAKSVELAPKASKTWEVPYYVGAKGHTWLSRYGAGLERSIDFGFFAQLGRGVLWLLDAIHGVTGNWGWSIVLLTVLIQICMFPLTYKSLKAMAAMKRLQPEIAKLQQRYANDPGKLQTEMMGLYKKHGANPLGGCLPMLVQMPVFIALYNALRNAWELHGASWMLWITDLSAKDPYYVLPVVMGAIMFLQNKLNPTQGVDPAQAKMMTFMPVIFTVMFVNFPSGLVLYWLTNSLVSTLQQLALRDHLNGPARA